MLWIIVPSVLLWLLLGWLAAKMAIRDFKPGLFIPLFLMASGLVGYIMAVAGSPSCKAVHRDVFGAVIDRVPSVKFNISKKRIFKVLFRE